jgi:hypothetical protein
MGATRNWHRRLMLGLLLAPALIWLFALIVLPHLDLALLSVRERIGREHVHERIRVAHQVPVERGQRLGLDWTGLAVGALQHRPGRQLVGLLLPVDLVLQRGVVRGLALHRHPAASRDAEHDLCDAESRPGEPGALPLLSHSLLATWAARDGRTLSGIALTSVSRIGLEE